MKASSSPKRQELPSVRLVDIADTKASPLEPSTEISNDAKMRLSCGPAVSALPEPRCKTVEVGCEDPSAQPLARRARREVRQHASATDVRPSVFHHGEACWIMPSSGGSIPDSAVGVSAQTGNHAELSRPRCYGGYAELGIGGTRSPCTGSRVGIGREPTFTRGSRGCRPISAT